MPDSEPLAGDLSAKEHIALADRALAQFEAWLAGAPSPPIVTTGEPPIGARSWVEYRTGAHASPVARGMAHWRDMNGGYHTEEGRREIKVTLTTDQLQQLGL